MGTLAFRVFVRDTDQRAADRHADPTAQPSYLTNDPESAFGGPGTLGGSAAAGGNAWETRFGLRVDLEAAIAYLGGPVTGEAWTCVTLKRGSLTGIFFFVCSPASLDHRDDERLRAVSWQVFHPLSRLTLSLALIS